MVPDWSIDAHDIDLTVTGASALSVTHHDASFPAAGDMYVSSTVWRQGRWDREESDPAQHDVGCTWWSDTTVTGKSWTF